MIADRPGFSGVEKLGPAKKRAGISPRPSICAIRRYWTERVCLWLNAPPYCDWIRPSGPVSVPFSNVIAEKPITGRPLNVVDVSAEVVPGARC